MITCIDCKKLREKGFFVCTSAERTAVANHLQQCPPCSKEVTEAGIEAQKKLKLSPAEDAIIALQVFERVRQDKADSENQNVPS